MATIVRACRCRLVLVEPEQLDRRDKITLVSKSIGFYYDKSNTIVAVLSQIILVLLVLIVNLVVLAQLKQLAAQFK